MSFLGCCKIYIWLSMKKLISHDFEKDLTGGRFSCILSVSVFSCEEPNDHSSKRIFRRDDSETASDQCAF